MLLCCFVCLTFTGAVYYLNEPYVEFPPARPMAELLHSICEYSSHRLRYPPGYFPRSGVSHFRRCGRAIDRLESWYTTCCTGQMTQDYTLCCAEQAVSPSLGALKGTMCRIKWHLLAEIEYNIHKCVLIGV